MQDGTAQLQVSRMLPHLQQLSCFVQRCEHTAVQIVEQLAALYGSSKDATRVIDAAGIHFQVCLYTHTHSVKSLSGGLKCRVLTLFVGSKI